MSPLLLRLVVHLSLVVVAWGLMLCVLVVLRAFDAWRLSPWLVDALRRERAAAWKKVYRAVALGSPQRLWRAVFLDLLPVHKKVRLHFPNYSTGVLVMHSVRWLAAPILLYDGWALARDVFETIWPDLRDFLLNSTGPE